MLKNKSAGAITRTDSKWAADTVLRQAESISKVNGRPVQEVSEGLARDANRLAEAEQKAGRASDLQVQLPAERP